MTVEDLLKVLTRMPVVCHRHRLAGCTSLGWDALDDLLETAEAQGLVEVWDEAPGALAIVLTPLAASRLQIEIDAAEERWQPIGTPLEPIRRSPSRERSEADLLEDPDDPGVLQVTRDPAAHEPILELVAIEVAEKMTATMEPPEPEKPLTGSWRFFDGSLGRVPYPRVILGITLPWPVSWSEGTSCPCCQGRRLEVSEYCLVCERSGVDRFLPPVLANQLPRPYHEGVPPGLPVPCKNDPGYVERDGVKVPERFARLMKG